jgi:Terminase large subunit, T4likevirus-type, N-terminal
LGLAPDDCQQQLLTTQPRRALLCLGRQCGKSTASAVLAVHEALFHPGALVLLLSPSLRQSGELFRRVSGFWRRFPNETTAINESSLRLELNNGSRIISLPASDATVRGYSNCSLLIIDEASRVPDALIGAITPSLAVSDGRLIALSTPFGRRGWLWQQWSEGGDSWYRVTLRSDQCKRISAQFLADERKHLGEWLYKQEYLCEFIDPETSVFSSQLTEAALTDEVAPLWT